MRKFLILLLLFSVLVAINYKNDVISKNIFPINSVEDSCANCLSYTHDKVLEEDSNSSAFFAIIENSKEARPQCGLSDADIVIETMAEGGIPRFMALFQKNHPLKIGPIRSVRKVFTDFSQLFNIPFAHCGASSEALSIIKNKNLMSMNEMFNSNSFYRDNTRFSPHNLYTSSDELIKLSKSLGYLKTSSLNLNFDDRYWDRIDLKVANKINIPLSNYYSTSYIYEYGKYKKLMDDIEIVDANTNNPLNFSNVFIQLTNISLKDGSLLDIKVYGNGDGYIFSKGKCEKVTWEVNDSSLKLVNENGEAVPFHSGNTIWMVENSSTDIQYN